MTLPANTTTPETIARMREGEPCRRCGGEGKFGPHAFCFTCSGAGRIHHVQAGGQYSQDYNNLVVQW